MSVLGAVGSGLWGAAKFGGRGVIGAGKASLGLASNVLAAGSDTYKSAQPTLSRIGNININPLSQSNTTKTYSSSGGTSESSSVARNSSESISILKKINENTKNTFGVVEDMAFTINEDISENLERSYNVLQLHTKLLEKISAGGGEKKDGKGIWGTLIAAATPFVLLLKGAFTTPMKLLGGLSGKLIDLFSSSGLIGKGIKVLSGLFSNLFSKAGSLVRTLAGTFTSLFTGLFSKMGRVLSGVMSSVASNVSGIFSKLGKFAGPAGLVAAAGAAGYAAGDYLKDVKVGDQTIQEHATDFIDSSVRFFTGEKEYDPNAESTPEEKKMARERMARADKGLPALPVTAPSQKSTTEKISENVQQKAGAAGAAVSSGIDTAKDKTSELADEISDGIEDFVDTVSENSIDLVDNISEFLGDKFDTMQEFFSDIVKGFEELPEKLAKSIQESFETAKTAASGAASSAGNFARGTYRNITASPETISKNSSFIESLRDKDPYMYGLAMKESSGGKNLFATTSSAAGAWQFTEGTWQDNVKKMGKDYTLEDRLDPEKAYEVAKFFDQQNRQGLQKSLGREVSSKDAYMAHFLGQGGAQQFLSKYDPSNPNQTGVELAGNTAAEANRNIFYDESGKPKSSKQVYDSLTRNFSGAPEDTIGSSMLASNNVTKTEKLAKNNVDARQAQQATPQVAVVQQPVPVQTGGGGGGSSSNTTVNNYNGGTEDPVIRRLMSEMALARYGIAGAGFA